MAQDYRYELGGRIGTAYYQGDAGRRGLIAPQGAALSLLGRVNPNLRWAWVTELGYRGLRGHTNYADNLFPEARETAFATNLINLRCGTEFHFFPLSDRFRYLGTKSLSPFVGAGVGMSLAWAQKNTLFSPGVYLAGGVKYRVNRRVSLEAEWQWQYVGSDRLDALSDSSAWLANPFRLNARSLKGRDALGVFSLGVTYQIGLKRQGDCN